jgi:hypothetical protein
MLISKKMAVFVGTTQRIVLGLIETKLFFQTQNRQEQGRF